MKQRIIGSYKKLKTNKIAANLFNLSGIQISNLLLLILLIPVINLSVGNDNFGIIMLASRYCQLAGSVVNYGTGQSGVRDIAINLNDNKKLSAAFYNNLYIRVLIFILLVGVVFAAQWFKVEYYNYILLSMPIALAEVANPLCFFIGTEKIKVFNLYNLLSNITAVTAILFFIKGADDAIWVNFILGSINTITYTGLLIYFIYRYKISFHLSSKTELLKIGVDNFYLTINNVSINLQQNIILFALPKWGYDFLLGPYSLCDRIIGQCRNLLITVSNALYPNTVHIYKQSTELWKEYRRKMKYRISAVFLAGSLVIFIMAPYIIYILSPNEDKGNDIAVIFLRIMAFVPTVAALNSANVLDQLVKHNSVYIFRIALILFVLSVSVAFVLINLDNYLLIGLFTLIIETSAWLMYEYVIKKPSLQNA